MYNLLTTVGRTSGHKYYTVLEQFTNPGFPSEVEDRYRELMWTHRRYLQVALLRSASRLFPSHPDIDSSPGDQSFDCVACPRPGFNFEWAEVSEDEKCWFRLWYSYDGNFRSVRKSKKVDPADIACSDDLAYFVMKEIYKTWTESIPQPKREEKPNCDNHKAGNDTSVRWVGNDITGIGAWSCTSHSCIAPHGVVDFFKGERFNYADYALATLLCHLLKRRGGSLPIGITYDVWCHYKTNLFDRLKLVPPEIVIPEGLDLVGAVPKWHLLGHKRECTIRYSLDNMPFVGRLEGEGVERFWSHLNQHSGSTSEQSPGYRTDSINNVIREWNKDKAYGMHTTLPIRYKDAKHMLEKEKAIHEDLTSSFENDELIQRWEKESIEPMQGSNGEWSSPLMDPELPSGGYHEAIREERKKESPTARVPGRRPGATRWISDGIELEHSIRNYNDEAKKLGDPPVDSQNAKQIGLCERIEKFLKQREYYMPDVAELDVDKPRPQKFYGEKGGDVDLGMPSSYKPETIEAAGLSSMANLEKEIRRGMCNESLASVKRLLRVRAQGFKYKRRHIRGGKQTTRAESTFRSQMKDIKKAGWRYSNSYEALKQLGLSESDKRDYHDLLESDFTALKSYYDDYAKRKKGEMKPTMSWIWRTKAAPNSVAGDAEDLKTEWFRSRERYKRWEEQLVLTKREMVMTIRSFQRYQELWEWKSRCPDVTNGMRAYARGQSLFYSKLANQMLKSCREYLYDDSAKLKWCDDWLRENVLIDNDVVTLVTKF
ncbi:Phosphatidylinositol 3-kinase VPS34 [Rhizoctonia solani]|uniref:Phosphatidylinositol 3-kinase VPS34 n=1 Tax=Rhizoctonia solani TaxID=456999 RepID=A0A0K6GIQ5_9AGAM|nr:Phosphatidylinositol 3-kinase VPS34 [Rhizoctonia solani]